MNKNKRFFRLFSILIIFVLCFSSLPIKAKSSRVIRVGYPLMEGLSMKDKDGNYYGYDYDYLIQIAQYTGWEYEFVEVEGSLDERLTKLMDMLEKGQIDLMGDTKFFDSLAEQYDFSSEPYGSAYNVIIGKDDSEIQDLDSLIIAKSLKIGVVKNSKKRSALLDHYAEMNGFTYEKVECESDADLLEKLENNEVDAALQVDLNVTDKYHTIAKFSPDPFYFITTKGNSDIIAELNQALVNINKVNPTFSSDLYNRYFGHSTNKLVLNNTEKEYIKQHPEMNVLICSGSSPIEVGVGKNILEKISKEIGVKFHYEKTKDFEDCRSKVANKKTDIILGIPFEIDLSDIMNINLSDPYLTSNLVLAAHKGVDPTNLDKKKRALTPYDMNTFDTKNNISYYESYEKIMDALEHNDADYAYLDSYVFTYYMNKYDYANISNFSTADYLRSQFAFGVTKSQDLALVSILNKAIRSQEKNIENYVYKNAYVERQFSFTTFIQRNILMILFVSMILILLIIYFIRSYYNKQLQMKKAVELEFMRYQMLSDISGEATFSYDYTNDLFKVNNLGIGELSNEALISNYSTAIMDKEKYPDILRLIQECLEQRKDIIFEAKSSTLINTDVWLQISLKVIFDIKNGKKTAVYGIGKVLNIQKQKEESEQLRIKSETDILTGIMNRGAAQDMITETLQNESGIGALLMVDLDKFKNVNDTYGHIEGDQVLIETAQMLNDIFHKDSHVVARLGGDEFVIYVGNTSEEEVKQLCNLALERIQHLPSMNNRNVSISMSIGIVFTTCSTDYVALMKLADQMLYEVKRNGRDGYKIFNEKL